jgi:hypothetical protein
MVRWEYAVLNFSYHAKNEPDYIGKRGSTWTWISEASLGIRGVTVARWKTERAEDANPRKPVVWSPVGDSSPEYAVEVGSPAGTDGPG